MDTIIADCRYCGAIDVDCIKDGAGHMACMACVMEGERELERAER